MFTDPGTVAEAVKAAGYKTALFGKWHLGQDEAHHPLKQGFDEAIVSNGRLYGGPYVVAPAADLRRPVLSVCLFERGGRLQVAHGRFQVGIRRRDRRAGFLPGVLGTAQTDRNLRAFEEALDDQSRRWGRSLRWPG